MPRYSFALVLGTRVVCTGDEEFVDAEAVRREMDLVARDLAKNRHANYQERIVVKDASGRVVHESFLETVKT